MTPLSGGRGELVNYVLVSYLGTILYMQIGRPIPASSWSRIVQFSGPDTTFVHVVTPYFHSDGDVVMMMPRDDIK